MKRFFVCLVLSSFLFFSLLAIEKTDSQKEKDKKVTKSLIYHLLVTATRTQNSYLEVASSASVITSHDLEQKKPATVSEAISMVEGIHVSQYGGPGNTTKVFIRGANSEHTLVMVDGVEMNDPITPGRSFDFAHLSTDNIERIEVVRGPQSTLYGSDAMGGVIHVFTKKGLGKPKLSLSFEGGSYSTFKERVGYTGGSKKMDYALTISRHDTKGFSASHEKYDNRERDGYGNTSLSANFGLKPIKNFTLNFITRYINANGDLDSGAGEGGDDPNYIYKNRQLILGAEARLKLFKETWQQKLNISFNNSRRNYEDGTDELHPFTSSEGLYEGKIFKIDWQHDVNLFPNQTITAGIEYEKETGESEYSYGSSWGPGESIFPRESADNTGIYLQDDIRLWDRVFVTLGFRSDQHSMFGNAFTYRIAPGVILNKGTRIKASYGTGFKAPSLYQLYAPATAWSPMGNLNLKPEKSKGWDMGVEQTLMNDRLSLGVVYFKNQFKEMIMYDWQLGYINLLEADTQGMELSLFFQNRGVFSFQGNYTYTKTEDQDTGEKLLRRPKHRAHVGLNYHFFKRWAFNLSITYVGKRDDIYPYPQRVVADPYTLANLVLTYDLSKEIQVFLKINNILNKEYETVMGYGTARRSAYIGFKTSL